SKEDYNKALIEGLWTIYDQYLTVQPWLSSFNTSQSLQNHLVVWIQLPGLSGSFFKKCLLEAVGNSIGQLIKVDNQTENRIRGQSAKMAAYIEKNEYGNKSTKPQCSRFSLISDWNEDLWVANAEIIEEQSKDNNKVVVPTLGFSLGENRGSRTNGLKNKEKLE
ncbi:hypothetical protein Goarm_003431, partial [Gossypium armourianum]|nr:hypothetical protein [Gossypium armourianum]